MRLKNTERSTQNDNQCPKYNWKKMDAYERVQVNLMDAVGAKNVFFGGMFGLFIFVIAAMFFRKQIVRLLTNSLTKGKDNE